jgi:hypothetical protein
MTGLDLNKCYDEMLLSGDDAKVTENDPLLCTQDPSARGYNLVEGVGKSPTLANQVHANAIPGVLGEKQHVLVANDGTNSSAPDPKGFGHHKVPMPTSQTKERHCTLKLIASRNDDEGSSSGLVLNSKGSLSVVSSYDDGPAMLPRKRGRPRKVETPKMDKVMRRSTRSNNNGDLHRGLPDTRRRASSVPSSSTPVVLQIAEVQRLEVENFHIDPKDLTKACLMQDRSN